MANSTSQDPTTPEQDSVASWAEQELLSFGFTDEQAKHLLTIPGLKAATVREKFISKGCSAELAYRILS